MWGRTRHLQAVIDIEPYCYLEGQREVKEITILLIRDFRIFKKVTRYYLSDSNPTKNVLERKNQEADYPEQFKDDTEFHKLFESVSEIISHNIDNDLKYLIDYIDLTDPSIIVICTLQDSINVCKIPRNDTEYKLPSLEEVISFFDIYTKSFEGDFHSSLFDAECCYEVYKHLQRRRAINQRPIDLETFC